MKIKAFTLNALRETLKQLREDVSIQELAQVIKEVLDEIEVESLRKELK